MLRTVLARASKIGRLLLLLLVLAFRSPSLVGPVLLHLRVWLRVQKRVQPSRKVRVDGCFLQRVELLARAPVRPIKLERQRQGNHPIIHQRSGSDGVQCDVEIITGELPRRSEIAGTPPFQ